MTVALFFFVHGGLLVFHSCIRSHRSLRVIEIDCFRCHLRDIAHDLKVSAQRLFLTITRAISRVRQLSARFQPPFAWTFNCAVFVGYKNLSIVSLKEKKKMYTTLLPKPDIRAMNAVFWSHLNAFVRGWPHYFRLERIICHIVWCIWNFFMSIHAAAAATKC